MKPRKWKVIKGLWLCKCGLCFSKRKDFIEHLKDTKRYRNKHYAMDYREVGFKIYLVKKDKGERK